MTTQYEHIKSLKACLFRIASYDQMRAHEQRNRWIIQALHHALEAGYPAGIRIDPQEPEWPVVFIEIDTGQLSWHLPQHRGEWDKHTVEEKYDRIRKFIS